MVAILEQEKAERRLHDSPSVNWWGIVQYGLMAIACLYLYVPVLTMLVADWWDDPDYSHGFLVPVLAAYFVWRRRQKLAEAVPQSSWWGIGVLLIGILMLILGNIGAELFLMRSSMIVVIVGLVLYHLGGQHLKLLASPIAFLLFMIPLPAILLNAITLPLQLLAARLSTFSLQFVGLPVYREGNIIFLPRTTLEIIEACSGLRSLMSLLALGVVFAYMTQRHTWKRVLLVVSAVPIALIANAFRIWGTGVLAHFYGTQVAEGFYHTFAGWVVFVVAFALLAIEGLALSHLHFKAMHPRRIPR
ncbi:MAG: exosortase A [Candidatus Binatia bacterium]